MPSRRSLGTGDTPLVVTSFGGETPLGYEQLTVSSGVVGFAAIPAQAAYALIDCEGTGVRWRSDGVNPTASVGMRLVEGDKFICDIGDLTKIKFIRISADTKLNISYY